MIWLTSDLHLFHNKAFIYEPRGFLSVEAMNEAIERNWNEMVNENDDVYILGDLMVGGKIFGNDIGMEVVRRLKGKKHIIIGNHDTNTRIKLFQQEKSIIDIQYALLMSYKGHKLYMSHYPTFTVDLEHESPKQWVINLFGHTHSKERFYEGLPYMYNVALDAHENRLVLLDDALQEITERTATLYGTD